MGIRLKLQNIRFGKLLVVEGAGVNKRGSYMWLCKCDCGKEKIISGASLKYGVTNSCGCGVIESIINKQTNKTWCYM